MQGRAPIFGTRLIITLIVLATALAYAGSFEGTWISDDVDMVAGNPLIRTLTPSNLRELATSRTDGTNYIPLNFLSLAIDAQLWGVTPAGFHLTNLLLHIANAIAIYFLVLRLLESPGIAMAASLLWALHPVQVESVAWISERKNVLSTLFFVLAFHAYLRFSARPRVGTYLLLTTLFVGALLSKVNTIVLPALTLVYEIALQRRLRLRDTLATVPLFACGAIVAWANLHGNQSHGVAYHGGSLANTMRTSATTIPRYLANVVAPFDLASYYPVPLRDSWLDPPVLTAAVLILVLVALTVGLAWRGYREAFWLAWFGITLSPMLNLVPFPALMNDRYLYLPLVGALVLVLRLGRMLLERIGMGRASPALVGAVALGLAWLTFVRVPVFRNDLNLWADYGLKTSYITADRPYGAKPRIEATQLLTEALERYPNRAAILNNLGAFAFEENRLPDALPLLERARQLDPNDPVIALNLGRTYALLRRPDDATSTLEAAAQLEPASFFPHFNLAKIYLQRGDLVRARAELDRAKAIKAQPFFWSAVEAQLARAEAAQPRS